MIIHIVSEQIKVIKYNTVNIYDFVSCYTNIETNVINTFI
jgi:hypothetical protein